jgi:hypothetical protein
LTYSRIREKGTIETRADNPSDRMQAIKRIVDRKQYEKIDGQMIDLFSASAIVKVYEALSKDNQEKFACFPAGKMGIIAFKLLK